MNYNEHIANDLLDTHKVRTLKTDENNKENAQATGKYLANVSISSLGAGILSETQLNMSNNGLLSSASFFNPNESFDCDKIKLDAYEKSVTKLENENKQLRKRVKKLTELAREKEQEIIESLNTFTEEKQKLEQKNQQEFQSQLQTYYECFLSIEKENDQLKRKTDKMRNKLIEQQDKLEELSRSKQNDDIQSTVESIMISSTLADGTDENEIILNTMSMRHINDELNNATKTAESFIEKAIFLESSQREDQDTSVDTNLLKQEIEQLKQKIDEKVAQVKWIEKSLRRCFFRANDDQCNLKKLEEKCEKLEADIKTLTSENQRIKAAKESETKLLELSQIQLNDTQLILDQTRLLLTDKENHINRLTTLSNQLEVENQELVLRLENYWNKVFFNMGTQTEVQNNNKTTSSCSKLNELAAVNNGHVAKTAAKFNTNTNTNQPAGLHPQTSSSDVNPELKSVKIKNDNLIIEKSQLKFKNDELKFENDELKLKIEDLLKQIESNKSMHASTASVSVNTTNLKTKQQTASPRPAVFSQSVQTIKLAISNQETQTNQVLLHHTVSNNSGSDLLWKARFDSVKQELEHSKSESLSEMNRLKTSLANQIETLQKACDKLKSEIEQDKLKLAELKNLNKELNSNLIAKTTQCSHMEQSIAKMNNDHKKEKQISDTIIYQQKKLLDFLQNKINPDDQDSAHTNNNQAGIHHLANIKFKITNKRSKTNPLLANLNKPSIPYQFANSNNGSLTSSTSSHTGTLSSTGSCEKKTAKEIEAELNSNYVAYSELARERKPPSIPAPLPKPVQQENEIKQQQQVQAKKNYNDKKIHVFITGLNTFPIYCDVCQHLIPLIAYASKCQICSFTCHSNCSKKDKSISSKSKTALSSLNSSVIDPLKYCHMNYLKISQLYNNYITKLSTHVSVSQLDKANSSLLADFLHVYMDNKWKKYWVVLRIDGQLEIYQKETNLKPFETINLVTDKIMFETDYNLVKKFIAPVTNASSNLVQKNHEEEVNLYEQVDLNQKHSIQDQLIDFAQSSLIILIYNQRISHQIGFDTFSAKSVWLDALQSACLCSHKNTKQLSQPSDQFRSYSLDKVLNPFLELSDTAVNSYCVISQKLILLACDDGLYINQIESESSSTNISLIKIDSIESAHKLSYQPEFGKLCLIGKRSRQFLSIDINELLSKPLIEQQQQQGDIDYEQEEDYPKINVKIEHIQNIDRCHLFESYLSQNGYWYLAVATPETIFVLLFNKTTSKYTLVKTINTQADSPCLCLKFSVYTNQLIYGCSKEFFKLDMTYLQATPIMDCLSKKNIDEDFIQLIKLQKQPIGICVINQVPLSDQTALLLCYEEYALILTFNKASSSWQLQQMHQPTVASQSTGTISHKKSTLSSSSSSSISSNASLYNCLKWPRGSPPLQIEFNSNNLYLFYNDSIITYKVSFDQAENFFLFKKSGVAFIYKPRHLSSYQHGNDSYLIISNRRSVNGSNQMNEQANENNRPYYDYEANDYNDDDMLNDDEIKSGKAIGLEQDDNDRICLSHFCCP